MESLVGVPSRLMRCGRLIGVPGVAVVATALAVVVGAAQVTAARPHHGVVTTVADVAGSDPVAVPQPAPDATHPGGVKYEG